MDLVTIGDRAVVSNSVVCAGAVIGSGASVVECQVSDAYRVADDQQCKREALLAMEGID